MTRAGELRPVDPAWQAGGGDPVAVRNRSDEPDDHGPEPLDVAVVVCPATISAILSCPSCDHPVTVAAKLFARVTKDSDGTGALSLRTRAAKVAHVCGQTELGLAEGPRTR